MGAGGYYCYSYERTCDYVLSRRFNTFLVIEEKDNTTAYVRTNSLATKMDLRVIIDFMEKMNVATTTISQQFKWGG